ncbi:hypothetical protein FORC47_0852 [Bacillus cereus]|nr:hypothetical protein [Bacillus thuringiensis]ASL63697.1 hypothetical protein FORC47_0852 [Bacillus cereus]
MKKAMILVISAVILIAGGYIGMKYVEKKNKRNIFGRNKKHG